MRKISQKKNQKSILDNIPFTYPAFLETSKIQKKVAAVGFEYKNEFEAIKKVYEETKELEKEVKLMNKKKIKEELGDLIFATLDVSRKLKLDPQLILKKANKKFTKRWKKLETIANKNNLELNRLSIKEYELLWQKVKN